MDETRGDQRGALGEFVLAAFAVEHELVQGRLHHRQGRGQFLQVDQPASVRVRGRQESRWRPAGAVRRCRATGCRADRPGPTARRGHRHTRGRLAPRPAGRFDFLRSLGHPRPPPVDGLRPAAPGCRRVRSGAASNRRRWYRSWHAPGWHVGWMSCGADGPLGRPAYAPPTPDSGSPGCGGRRWTRPERRGEATGGRLVTGRETKEGRRSACAKPRGTRAKHFVLDIVHDRVDRQHRSHRARRRDHASRPSWPVSFVAGATARMPAAASSSGPDSTICPAARAASA